MHETYGIPYERLNFALESTTRMKSPPPQLTFRGVAILALPNPASQLRLEVSARFTWKTSVAVQMLSVAVPADVYG